VRSSRRFGKLFLSPSSCQNKGTGNGRNFGNNTPNDTASHPTGTESSVYDFIWLRKSNPKMARTEVTADETNY
jgi:hypothetical protein